MLEKGNLNWTISAFKKNKSNSIEKIVKFNEIIFTENSNRFGWFTFHFFGNKDAHKK